jgi:hypothetical protein
MRSCASAAWVAIQAERATRPGPPCVLSPDGSSIREHHIPFKMPALGAEVHVAECR